jgi:hypothetical protein
MTESDRAALVNPRLGSPDPLRASLSDADDRLLVNRWMPPQRGIAPRIRIGRRWINTLWGFPIGAAALLCMIALAQSLRELPSVTAFIQRHPGIAQSAPSVDSGFPWWLELQHFLNMFFMRAGLQILAAIRDFIGGGTAHRGRIGFASKSRYRRGGFGRLRTIRSLCQRGLAFRAFAILLGCRGGGISPSTCSG